MLDSNAVTAAFKKNKTGYAYEKIDLAEPKV